MKTPVAAKSKAISLDVCPWCHAPLIEHNLASMLKHARKYRERLVGAK